MAARRTGKQVAASRRNLVKARAKRSRRGTYIRAGITAVAMGAVAGGGLYAYQKNPKFKRAVNRNTKGVAKFVGGMVKTPAGAIAHLQAAKGAVQGKKHGANFLHSSVNWHQMERAHPGQKMYSVGG